MTFSDCWIRKVGEPLPQGLGEAFHIGRITDPPPGHYYWMPVAREWAENNGLPFD